MRKSELLKFEAGLNSVSNLKGVKFAYAVAKNLSKVKPEIEAIKKSSEPYENLNEYEKLRLELCEKHAKRDDKGVIITESQQYVMEDIKVFNKAFDKLRKESKEALNQRDDQIKKLEEFLKEESTLELHKIKIEDLPEEITAIQITGIEEMIID